MGLCFFISLQKTSLSSNHETISFPSFMGKDTEIKGADDNRSLISIESEHK